MGSYSTDFAEDAWRSATFCGPNGGNCVEVNLGARNTIGVRDSKSVTSPFLAFDQTGWGAFLDVTKSGRLTVGSIFEED
jgi:hypothetical protein